MKKVLVILALGLVPFCVSAQLQFGIGPAAFYNSPVMAGDEIDVDELNVSQFTFGGNARLKVSLFQAEALALLSFGEEATGADIFLDAGLAFDLALLRLSAGIGPKYSYVFGEDLSRGGYNLKVNADVLLGGLSLGLSYILDVTLRSGFEVENRAGLLGVSLIFW